MQTKNKISVDRINYCFYMPVDFSDKFEIIQADDDRLKALSKSQALNLIISEMATKILERKKAEQAENHSESAQE